jgi:hypothetical protein
LRWLGLGQTRAQTHPPHRNVDASNPRSCRRNWRSNSRGTSRKWMLPIPTQNFPPAGNLPAPANIECVTTSWRREVSGNNSQNLSPAVRGLSRGVRRRASAASPPPSSHKSTPSRYSHYRSHNSGVWVTTFRRLRLLPPTPRRVWLLAWVGHFRLGRFCQMRASTHQNRESSC